jgi:hypothetical protein
MEHFSLPQPHLDLMVSVLTKRFAPCTAYVFGSRSPHGAASALLPERGVASPQIHYDILVFTARPCPDAGANAADVILQQSKGTFGVTLLLHRVIELGTAYPCRQWFFYNAIRNGRRLCLDTSKVPYLPGHDVPSSDVGSARRYWQKCEGVAGLYMESAATAQLGIELVKVAMLHTAIEYAALGMIRVFLGYSPNAFSLRFLLGLCGHFTGLPDEMFPQNTDAECSRFKRLCAPPSMLRHWDRLEAPEADFDVLYGSCLAFLEKAAVLVNDELVRISETSKILCHE